MTLMRTALHSWHVSQGAKMVPFAGWEMPVEFEGLRKEHQNVRENVGLFDVSHMGEIRFRGPNALATLEYLTTNSVSKLEKGRAHYSLFTNEDGGIVDDIIVYCLETNHDYLVCVNASNVGKVWSHVRENNKGAEIINESERWGQIAVQGPRALQLVKMVFSNLPEIPFSFIETPFDNENCIVARTGYTGEPGVEIFVPNQLALSLWEKLWELGRDLGVMPIGLGARDTLRTEMKYSLYGHEIDDTTNPLEAGLSWVVKIEKDFLGAESIRRAKKEGLTRKLIGFKMLDKGIPRQGYELLAPNEDKGFDRGKIGTVTSGTLSPSLGEAIGIGYVAKDFSNLDQEILVNIRGRHFPAKIVKTPFVKT